MGEQKNICTFEQRNCAELNHVDEIPWAKDRPGVIVVQKQHKIKFGNPEVKAGEMDPIAENTEPVWNL